MALKVSGTTVIDDNRNIQNVGVITATTFNGNVTGNLTGNATGNINSTGVSTFVSLRSTNFNATGITTSSNLVASTTLSIGTGSVATSNVDLDVAGSYAGNVAALGSSDIDCSTGNYFTTTFNGTTTFTVSNVPSSRAYSFVLQVTHTSGTINWFSGVVWPGGTAPTLNTSKTHLFIFVTSNGGSTWRASSLVDYAS